MANAQSFADVINRDLKNLKIGTLRFWGNWFGRPYDNRHRIVAASAKGSVLFVQFNGKELLSVWAPSEVTVNETTFCIRDAERVRWEWFYYGRPQTPGDLYFEDHVKGQIGITNANWYKTDLRPDYSFPAVESGGCPNRRR